MKGIVTSDWHLDAYTAGVPRFDDVSRAVEETVHAAFAERAAFYLFLGDLTDPDSSSAWRSVARAAQAMSALYGEGPVQVNSFWMAGNHDVIEDSLGSTVLSPLAPVAHGMCARVIERPEVHDLGEGKMAAFLPYVALSQHYDPVEFLREVSKTYGQRIRLIAGHLMLEGIGPGSETEDMPRGRDVFFPIDVARELFPWAVLTCGHYHRRQEFNGVHIPGSLARLTRSEVHHEPGFMVLEIK